MSCSRALSSLLRINCDLHTVTVYIIADLVETCTYITAVLFYLEAVAQLKGKQTSTQV